MPSEANWTAMFYGFINGSDFKWLQKQIKDNKKNCRLKITNQQVDWENWRPYGSGELLLFPIFRQARPWLLQGMFTAEKRRYNLNNQDKSLNSITIKSQSDKKWTVNNRLETSFLLLSSQCIVGFKFGFMFSFNRENSKDP